MLSNIDLEDYAREQRFPIIAVVSKDELNDMEAKVGSYYINMEDSDKGNGTHWVFMRILPHPFNKAIYFDSFGQYAPKDVDEFLHRYKPYARNDRQIQDLKSEECGYFCLATDKYFTDHYDKSMDLDENYCKYLSIYSDDLKRNDNIVKEYLRKTI
jgi:hypothetical protein